MDYRKNCKYPPFLPPIQGLGLIYYSIGPCNIVIVGSYIVTLGIATSIFFWKLKLRLNKVCEVVMK